MKSFISAAAMTLCAIGASSQSTSLYVLPVSPDGSLPKENGQYTGLIPMTGHPDGSFTVENVSLSTGFYFYAQDPKSPSANTLYTITTWNIRPLVYEMPNALCIATEKNPYIPVSEGTYTIGFYPKGLTDQSYQMFTIVPQDGAGPYYPEHIYLVWGHNQYQELDGSEGVYKATMSAVSPFKIAYQPRTDLPAFIYGPLTGANVSIQEGRPVSIAYGKGTTLNFSWSYPDGTDTPVTISLVPGDSYILLGNKKVTSIDDASLSSTPLPVRVFTTSGIEVARGPEDEVIPGLAPGLYILRSSRGVSKIAVH